MPLKENLADFGRRTGRLATNLMAIGAGSYGPKLFEGLTTGPLKSNVQLIQEFYDHLSGSADLLSSHGQLLPDIAGDMAKMQEQVESQGFHNEASIAAAGLLFVLRISSSPLLEAFAVRAEAGENKKAAAGWRMVDKVWLGVQAFCLASALNIWFKGGPKTEAETALVYAGGMVAVGGVTHALTARAISRRQSRSVK